MKNFQERPSSTNESFLRGPSGSIRGHRFRVLKTIQKINDVSSLPTSSSSNSSYSSSSSDSESDISDLISACSSLSTQSSIDLTTLDVEDAHVVRSLLSKTWKDRSRYSSNGGRFTGRGTRSSSSSDDSHEGENNVIFYSSTLGVIRSTFEASNRIR